MSFGNIANEMIRPRIFSKRDGRSVEQKRRVNLSEIRNTFAPSCQNLKDPRPKFSITSLTPNPTNVHLENNKEGIRNAFRLCIDVV